MRSLRLALPAAFAGQVLANRQVLPPWVARSEVLCDVVFGLATVACWHRWRRDPDGSAWLFLGLAMTSYLAGNVYSTLVLRGAAGPSPADAGWLGFYLLTFVGIARFTRAPFEHPWRNGWLDGGIGGFGAAALTVALVFGPVQAVSGDRPLTVAVTLAYPVADVLLAVLLVVAGRDAWATDRRWRLIGAGLGLFFVGDCHYLYAAAAGVVTGPTSVFSLSWTAGVALIGLAALSPPSADRAPSDSGRYLVPVLFTGSSIGLLVYGQRHLLSGLALTLTVAALLLATVRVGLSLRDVHALASSRAEARTDDLTGLPNRRHLTELLDAALAGPVLGPVTLIVIDLDRFKEVNDSLGHIAGDRLLEQVGQRLVAAVGSRGTLARQGGDEFALVLPQHDAVQATAVAGQLRAALHRPIELCGLPVLVEASMGVASSPAHGRSAAQLLSRADIAMYQAKRSRSGVATFRVEHGNPSRERLELMADVHGALESEAFALYYQPQINLAQDQVCGAEALIRWEHPRHGVLLPAQFLPIIAQTGLLPALTAVVLRRARADWARLRGSGVVHRVSVNITAADLSAGTLCEVVESLLGPSGFGPRELVLEVTEDDVLRDRAHGHDILQRLRERGVLVSVDDYGTGQASLSYLRDLPLDEIKLDQSFVRGAPADTHNAAIVRSTIALAHTLGQPIVAEGIEDEATQLWLRSLACDVGQGYHIGRPMPLDQLLDWCRRRPTMLAPTGTS